MKLVFSLLALSLLLAGQAFAYDWHRSSNVRFVDEPSVEQQSLAETICGLQETDKSALIRHVSSLHKLEARLSALRPNDPLAACSARFSQPLDSLLELIELGSHQVCSPEKVAAIEQFHRRFVSTASADRANREEAPRVLKKFFMFYAMQVSATCKRSLLANLRQATAESKQATDESYLRFKLGSDFMGRFSKTLANFFEPVHSFTDVLLLWDILGQTKKAPSASSLVIDTVDEQSGEPIKMLIVTKDLRPLNTVKQLCRQQYRPVYSKTILPVVRLANLGYSFKDSYVEAQERSLKGDELARQWYQVTQFCELLLPIRFLQDESMKDSKDSMIVTPQEAQKYILQEEEKYNLRGEEEQQPAVGEPASFEPSNNSMEAMDALELVNSEFGRELVKGVKVSSSAQWRQTRRLLSKYARALKKAARGRMIFSSRAACALEASQSDCGSNEKRELRELLESKLDESKLEQLESGNQLSSRRKRESLGFWFTYGAIGLVLVGIVGVCVFLVVIFFMGVFG